MGGECDEAAVDMVILRILWDSLLVVVVGGGRRRRW